MLALTTYSVSVGIHVVAVVVCLGITFAFPVMGKLSRENPQHTPFALQTMKFAVERFVFPGYAIILLTGGWQASDANWFDADKVGWLHASMGLFLIVIALAVFVAYPNVKKLIALHSSITAEKGQFAPTPEFLAMIKKQATIGPFMGVSIIVITFLMEAKPF